MALKISLDVITFEKSFMRCTITYEFYTVKPFVCLEELF